MNQSPIRILCVDDNRLMAEALQRRLALESRIAWAGWVEHAAELSGAIRDGKPDVVMLDIDMPGRDSFDVLRELAENFPGVKVIMFSGHVRAPTTSTAPWTGEPGDTSPRTTTWTTSWAPSSALWRGEFVLSPDASSEYRRKP